MGALPVSLGIDLTTSRATARALLPNSASSGRRGSLIGPMVGWLPLSSGRTRMSRTDFELELREQGYADVVDRHMEANAVNPEHVHEFDARLLVLEGEMTITRNGDERTYRAG